MQLSKFINYILCCLVLWVSLAQACSNFYYHSPSSYWVARNFDWMTNHIAVVINPVGEHNKTIQLSKDEKPLLWAAKYGSLSFKMTTPKGTVLPSAVQGGMNTQGLVVSLQELSGSQFQKPSPIKPNINNIYLVQYWLDTAKNVPEALDKLKKLNVVTTWWYGKAVPIHYVLHDSYGNSAVVEFLKGRPYVYQGVGLPYSVVTNTLFTKSCVMAKKTLKKVPGGYSSDARLLRGFMFLNRSPKLIADKNALGFGFAALQDVAEAPNTPWPTQWSVVYDTKRLVVFYRTLNNPQLRIVNLSSFDFMRKLQWKI